MTSSECLYDSELKVLTTKDEDLVSCEGGLGLLFYNAMKLYGSNIAEINILTEEKQTYSSILNKSICTAQKLQFEGLQKNDIVCICSENNLDTIVCYTAALFSGAIVSGLDPTVSLIDSKYLLNEVKPKFVFVGQNCEHKIELCATDAKIVVFGESNENFEFGSFVNYKSDKEFKLVEANEDDNAVIFFSSGTTGLPKGISVSHLSLLHQSRSFLGYAKTDVSLGFATIYWISTALTIIKCILSGHCRLIYSEFYSKQVWRAFEKFKVTTLISSPYLALKLISDRHSFDVSSLADIIVGGSILTVDNINKLKKCFSTAHVTYLYGQTEVGVFCYFPKNKQNLAEEYPSSVGMPCAGYSLKIVDPETDTVLGPNRTGEVRVLTKYKMNGYWKKDSSDVFDEFGFVKTGDLGYYNEQYCVFVTNRLKDVFKYCGWHITPGKLEPILKEHPAVTDVAIIGIPHATDDNHIMGVVIVDKTSEIAEEELLEYFNAKVEEREKMRGGLKIVDSFPLTPSGKIKRNELRDDIIKKMEIIN